MRTQIDDVFSVSALVQLPILEDPIVCCSPQVGSKCCEVHCGGRGLGEEAKRERRGALLLVHGD